MNKPLKRIAILLATAAVVSVVGCSKSTVKNPASEESKAPKNLIAVPLKTESVLDKLDWRAYENYVNAVIAEQARDYYTASRYYYSALQKYPDSYEIRYSLAEMYYRMQRFIEALNTLKPIFPESREVFALRALCHRSKGDNESARNSYLKVLKVDSTDENAYAFLASEYRRINNLDSLLWTYERLVNLEPTNPKLWTELGQLQYEKKQYDVAIESFNTSLGLAEGRGNFYAYIGLAQCYRETQKLDSASFYYNYAAELDPNNAYLTNEMATFYAEQDSIPQALHFAERLALLEPNNTSAKRYLALLFIRADSLLQAEAILRILVNRGDHDPGNYFYLGRIALIKRDFIAAQEYLTLLTQLADTLVDAWLDLGFVYRQQGDTAKSLNVYNSGLKFVKNKDDSVRILFSIGATQERNSNINDAARTFETVLKLDPEHSPSLNYLGYMLADRGEKLDYAKDLIGKALEILPENPAYIDSYGWVMYRLGKFDSAVSYLEKASELQSDPVIYDHLGDAYKAIGKTEDARIWWQKALELEPTNDAIREKLNE